MGFSRQPELAQQEHEASLSILELLLHRRADVNALDVSLRSPVFYISPSLTPHEDGYDAVKIFRELALRTLLTSRANPNFTDAQGLTCFEFQEARKRELAQRLTEKCELAQRLTESCDVVGK